MYQYPQYVFFSEISKLISNDNKNSNRQLGVDIPCGSGYTTHNLSQNNKLKWIGVDLDKNSIEYAKNNYQTERVLFEENDIFLKLNELKNVDVLCVINSIFLLPNHDKLFCLISSCLNSDGEAYFIIPNVNSINYKNFIKDNPQVNCKEYDVKSLIEELKKYNLLTKVQKGICYANIYGRKDTKLMRRFVHHYLIALNYLMTYFKISAPSYFLIHVKKQVS
jgi:SAM-dependent methyltransferase